MVLAGYIPNEQWHVFMPRHIGGHPEYMKDEGEKHNKESMLVKLGLSAPYEEPNDANYAMTLPPIGPGSSGKYSGMRIQVYIRCKGKTIWKTDSYY